VTSQHGQSLPEESARPASPLPARITSWAPWLVVGCYVLGAFALTWRLWADPAGQMVAGNSGDINLFAWFMRGVVFWRDLRVRLTGQATSYIYNRLSTAVYLTNLWQGH
jgi:hypothetical protein